MLFRHEYRGGVWVDLEQPSPDEIRDIAREFNINERIEAELLSPTPAPLVSQDEHAALLVLHFPVHKTNESDAKNQEIDIVVGANFIVTVRYEVVVSLHHLKKIMETQKLVGGHGGIATDVLLEVLFAHLYTSARDHVNHIASTLSHVEHDMFDGKESLTIRAISNISREFLHLEAALADQEDTLAGFLKMLGGRGFFGASFSGRAERILAERTQILRLVGTHRAIASELRETNNALLSARQNEVIKILTVVSFVFLPLALVAKIFSMKVAGMPFEQDPNAFWIILASMLVLASVLTLFVVRKRWI